MLAVTLAAACSSRGGGGGPSRGDLGFADFRWECAGAGDVACIPDRVAGFPRGVAVGATVEASFVLGDEVPSELEAGWIDLVGPKAELSSSTSGEASYDYESGPAPRARIHAREEGESTLLAMAHDDTVADYATLWLRPVTSLAVIRHCPEGEYHDAVDGDVVGPVSSGREIDVRVEPYGDGVLLVGHVDYVWESLTPDVAEVIASDGHVATLGLLREGTAYVQVAGGGVEDTVAIEVVFGGPHRQRPEPNGTEGTQTGTSTGAETDAQTDTDSSAGSGTDADTDASTGTTTGGMQ